MQGASRESAATASERFDQTVERTAGNQEFTRLGEELFAVVGLLDRELSLRRTLADPAIEGAAKARLAEGLLSRQIDRPALELLRGVVASRWAQPADMVDTVETLSASAVLAVAEREGVLDDVEDELFRFARLLEREPGLREALTDRAVATDRKTALLDDLLGDRVRPATLTLIRRAVLSPRGRTLDQALDGYAELAARRRSRLLAHVRVAAPLTQAQHDRLGRVLARIYGHPVVLQVEVDPEVLGGLSVRVGDEVIDGTVVSRLALARRNIG
jgi:F-type H+-transporting ATPase subunit delta